MGLAQRSFRLDRSTASMFDRKLRTQTFEERHEIVAPASPPGRPHLRAWLPVSSSPWLRDVLSRVGPAQAPLPMHHRSLWPSSFCPLRVLGASGRGWCSRCSMLFEAHPCFTVWCAGRGQPLTSGLSFWNIPVRLCPLGIFLSRANRPSSCSHPLQLSPFLFFSFIKWLLHLAEMSGIMPVSVGADGC